MNVDQLSFIFVFNVKIEKFGVDDIIYSFSLGQKVIFESSFLSIHLFLIFHTFKSKLMFLLHIVNESFLNIIDFILMLFHSKYQKDDIFFSAKVLLALQFYFNPCLSKQRSQSLAYILYNLFPILLISMLKFDHFTY